MDRTGQKESVFERRALVGAGLSAAVFAGAIAVFCSEPVKAWLLHAGDVSQPRPAYQPSLDPKLGTEIRLPKKDALGRIIGVPAGGHLLVVMEGACSECSLNSLPPERITSRRAGQIVIVYASSELELPIKRLAKLGWT